ncbi:MAG: HAD family hydrolase [Oscillospiraceae bacterium]|jgi:phosphoglycolate phosphatase
MANLIFDYDGTLHDCIKIYAPAFRLAYAYLVSKGFAEQAEWTDVQISRWLGYSARDMWACFMPDLSEKQKEICNQMVGDEMLRLMQAGQARLYPNTEYVLEQLKERGHTLLFLSNCKQDYLQLHREIFGLDRYFSAFYCAEEYGWKPKYEVFPLIQEQFAGEFVMIGDREKDMEVARYHGLQSIGCSYGYGDSVELRDATVHIDNILEILNFY